jgi:hypothetical protein
MSFIDVYECIWTPKLHDTEMSLIKKIDVYEFIWTPHVVVYDFCEITIILLETQVTGTANKQIL